MAVTKGFPPGVVDAAVGAGLADLGENYAQELLTKVDRPAAEARVRWHFVGRLQSNKVRLVADHVSLWQSVDRASLVGELARRAPGARVLVQVAISGEPTKGGVEPGETSALVERGLDAGLDVVGLMGVASRSDEATVAAQFGTLRRLVDRLDLGVCSMGMSGDLRLAVAEGATMVRVGTALFGPRPG